MSAGCVHINGEYVELDNAKISIFDSAVMLGDTVTESTRTFKHQPFKLDQHITRMYKSLKVTRIDPGCSPDEMKEITSGVVEANLPEVAEEDDIWIVHNISRGVSMPGPDPTVQQGRATVMIHTAPMDLSLIHI